MLSSLPHDVPTTATYLKLSDLCLKCINYACLSCCFTTKAVSFLSINPDARNIGKCTSSSRNAPKTLLYVHENIWAWKCIVLVVLVVGQQCSVCLCMSPCARCAPHWKRAHVKGIKLPVVPLQKDFTIWNMLLLWGWILPFWPINLTVKLPF